MAVIFAPGDKYLYRHLYTVDGIGGIVITTGTTVLLLGAGHFLNLPPGPQQAPKSDPRQSTEFCARVEAQLALQDNFLVAWC